jgi:hypothetical protein
MALTWGFAHTEHLVTGGVHHPAPRFLRGEIAEYFVRMAEHVALHGWERAVGGNRLAL